MAKKSLTGCLEHICRLAAVQTARELSDHELVGQFVAQKDEAAFALLVERHGPMILGACRRVLGSAHDAEDACQASFLILARKAATIRKTTSLASWLHRVASRVAAHMRRECVRRCKRERRNQGLAVRDPAAEVSWREVQAVLDEELERLPERLRAPLTLCYLDSRTRDEAAGQLGLSVACLHGRLERGRKALCERLARRGVTLSAALLATAMGEGVSRASLFPGMVLHTAKAAVLIHCGRVLDTGLVSTKVVSLAQGVATNMFRTKLKLGVSVVLCAGLLATALGGSLAAVGAGQAKSPPTAEPPQPAADKAQKSPTSAAQPTPRPTQQQRLSGHVLDPNGKPVAGAKVHLLQWANPFGPPQDKAPPKVWAETDKQGRFSFTAPPYQGELFVTAAGFAPGWETTGRVSSAVEVGKAQEVPAAQDDLVVRLAHDDVPVNGRLLDLQGEPVAGATVRVFALKASPDGNLDKWIAAVKKRTIGQDVPERENLSSYFVDELAHFFPPITTDKEGRFQIKGLGRERIVEFTVEGSAIETKVLHVVTKPGLGVADIRIPENGIIFAAGGVKELAYKPFYPPSFTHTADPCRVVTGVVRDKATGKPIAGAVVRGDQPVRYLLYFNRTTTDKEGRYRLTGLPATLGARPASFVAGPAVVALPPDGQPYLAVSRPLPADREAKEAKFDFDLAPGVWLEGQVKDRTTRRGVFAWLGYFAFTEWRLEDRRIMPAGDGERTYVDPFWRSATDQEGKFPILVAADRGMLGAVPQGEQSNHYRTGVGADKIKDLTEGAKEQPGAGGVFPSPFAGTSVDSFDALVEVKPAKGATSVRCDVELDPGRTVTVQVRGPDGKPLDGVRAHGQLARDDHQWGQRVLPAEFVVHGLAPEKGRTLLLDHPGKNLTARLELKGDERGQVVVTLQPAAAIVGRLVDDGGRPIAHAEVTTHPRLTGEDRFGLHTHSRPPSRTDAEGKFRIDGLVAEQSYQGFYRPRQVYLNRIFEDLSLKCGEVKGLGDVTVKQPDSK
jgi:RNA polymerase sigma factor (sigma-70 family)